MTDLVLLPGQRRLWECTADHILFVAGVASGKTQGGARWCLKQIVEQPYAKGFIGAQSYQQLSRVSMPAMLALLDEVGLEYVFNKKPPDEWGVSLFPEHERILSVRVPGCSRPCQIQTGSMDNYQTHRGIDFGWGWFDESREMAGEAVDVMQSRLRGQPPGTVYRTLHTTTPNGFGWLHRRYVAEPFPGSAVIRASTTENPYLPAGFVENLRAQYTEQYAKQEIDGEFLNLTAGQAFFAFNRAKHVAPVKLNPALGMWYAVDFNVSPLCSTYGQSDKIRSWTSGEVYISGSGRTVDAVEEFIRRHKEHPVKQVIVFGDQSGANRDTRNDFTDYDVIQKAFRAAGWTADIRRNFKNPPIVESIEAVNAHLEHGHATIDPSCKHLIADLEQCCWEEGTRVLDKSNSERTHLVDSFRYMVYKEFNAAQKASSSSILN